ncbi:MAG: hemerythrin domain-containing protein [Rubrivivax sp.]|nr:hemerythrin domain-containing protein [Rubrivivax sp.]
MAATTRTAASRPARPRRADVPPLPAPETMDETHRQIDEVLTQMETLLQVLPQPAQQAQAARLATLACSFFNGPARAHHEAEETQVFPALLAGHDAQVRAQVQQLQRDHNWIEEDWLELEPHLQAVAQGYGPEHLAFLRPALAEFTSLYREHLAVEEALLHR